MTKEMTSFLIYNFEELDRGIHEKAASILQTLDQGLPEIAANFGNPEIISL